MKTDNREMCIKCRNYVQLPFQHVVGKFHWCWSSSEGRHMTDTEANARAKMLIYWLENGVNHPIG